jgi:Right handed beta helix region
MTASPNHDVARRHPRTVRAGAAAAAALAATALIAAAAGPARAADLNATTANFASVFSAARAGDVIHLAPGDYGTFTGGTKSGPVTITGAGAELYANLGASQNLVLDGLTIEGLATNGAKNLTIRNSTFTAATVIQTPTSTPNANILIDHNTFSNINVCGTCYEGRLAIRGYQNTQPVGVTISNNLFGPRGDADGIQIVGGAYGVQIGPGNEFHDLAQVSQAHTDPIQLYGSTHTLITGNWLHDNATGIMAPDGSDHETITNNVIQTTGYPWPVVMGAAEGNVVAHNVFPGSGGTVEVDKSNSGAASSGNVVKDNVLANVANSSGGAPQGTTVDYNLISGGARGSHDIKGRPTFAGGSSPTSWAGFALAAGTTGTGKADDGTAIGIVPGAAGTPTNPAPGAGTAAPAGTATPATPAATSSTAAPAELATGPLAGASVTLAVKRSISHTRFTNRLRYALLIKRSAAPVQRVAFMIDGRWVATDRRAPYALSWKVPRHTRYGTHVLTVKAFAADGSLGTLSVKVRRVR